MTGWGGQGKARFLSVRSRKAPQRCWVAQALRTCQSVRPSGARPAGAAWRGRHCSTGRGPGASAFWVLKLLLLTWATPHSLRKAGKGATRVGRWVGCGREDATGECRCLVACPYPRWPQFSGPVERSAMGAWGPASSLRPGHASLCLLGVRVAVSGGRSALCPAHPSALGAGPGLPCPPPICAVHRRSTVRRGCGPQSVSARCDDRDMSVCCLCVFL